MKVVISGAQGVGKTTLMNLIKPHYQHRFTIITEIARSLKEKGIKINKEADHASQMAILEAHYQNCLLYDDFISDRGAIDAFTFATWSYLNGKFSYNEHREHESIFKETVYQYDRLFYIEPEFEIVKDGVRSTDPVYQNEINDLFLKLYSKYNLEVNVLSGSVENRFLEFHSLVLV